MFCYKFFLLLSIFCLGFRAEARHAPDVESAIQLPQDRWTRNSVTLEILEFWYRVKPEIYWKTLDLFASNGELAGKLLTATPKAQYDTLLEHFIDAGNDHVLIGLMKLTVSLRSYVPVLASSFQHTLQPSLHMNCSSWLEFAGDRKAVCLDDANAFGHNPPPPTEEWTVEPSQLLPIDHVKNRHVRPLLIATASAVDPSFLKFYHTFCLSRPCAVRYVPENFSEIIYLSGYGSSLTIKNTEYVATNDDNTRAKLEQQLATGDDDETPGASFREMLKEFKSLDMPSEAEQQKEFLTIDLKLASIVLKSSNPLGMLRFLTENLPEFAGSIAKLEKVNPELRNECESNNNAILLVTPDQGVFSTRTYVAINGIPLDVTLDNAHSLTDILIHEYSLMSNLFAFNLTSPQIRAVLNSVSTPYSNDKKELVPCFKVINTKATRWWNNLEKDKRYAFMSSDIGMLAQPWFPGRLHPVKRNIYNAIFVPNLSDRFQLGTLLDCFDWIDRGFPVRFGFIPWVPRSYKSVSDNPQVELAVNFARITVVLFEGYGKKAAKEFLVQAWRHQGANGPPTLEVFDALYKAAIKGQKSKGLTLAPVSQPASVGKSENSSLTVSAPALISNWTFAQVVEKGGLGDRLLSSTLDFLSRFLVGPSGAGFLNGDLFELSQGYQNGFFFLLSAQLRHFADHISKGLLSETDDLFQYYQDQAHVQPRLNTLVVGSAERPLVYKMINNYESLSKFGKLSSNASRPLLLVLQANLDSVLGLEMLTTVLRKVISCGCFLVGVVPKPGSLNYNAWRTILHGTESAEELLRIVSGHLDKSRELGFARQLKNTTVGAALPTHDAYIEVAGGTTGESTLELWLNGRFLSDISDAGDVDGETLDQLIEFEWDNRLSSLFSQLNLSVGFDSFVQVSSLVSAQEATLKKLQSWTAIDASSTARDSSHTLRRTMPKFSGKNLSLVNSGGEESAFFKIDAVIDPIEPLSQKWSAILETLAGLPGVKVFVRLAPQSRLEGTVSSLLKDSRFYQTTFALEPHFTGSGQFAAVGAKWHNLPDSLLFSLDNDTPNAWLITPVAANADLDNIRAGPAFQSVRALYRLRNLLVEGYASDSDTGMPPRGLQYILTNHLNYSNVLSDTITMANLGYFQLQAQPGIWQLFIRPGKSLEIYHLEKVSNDRSPGSIVHVDTEDYGRGFQMVIDSWNGLTLRLQARKNRGKELQEILVSDDALVGELPAEKNVWRYVSDWVTGSNSSGTSKLKTINVFSVASGHLYERFLSIMMLSVRNSTSHPLKFWLIEQYLSPSFKEFVPRLAKKHNFEVVFVTYKWPHWLIAQKEKQRTIWGYKILFLDVLFPLSLDHVIFVDADQIVRADLGELVKMDLKGAPYGYTPFCNSREEMSGFRFWQEGYWKEHLQGKPYHISALYIVNLRRFREIAAGDRLRGQYQSLSRDPNSLSNLDQDLPNNMQHVVPIFSLPQDWLWCETWCSSESLKTAKTIDLCNNPLTKEPKLDRAKRLLPEWTTFDQLVQQAKSQFVSDKSDIAEQAATKSVSVEDEL